MPEDNPVTSIKVQSGKHTKVFEFLPKNVELDFIMEVKAYYEYFTQLNASSEAGQVFNTIGFPSFYRLMREKVEEFHSEKDEKKLEPPKPKVETEKKEYRNLPELKDIKGIGPKTVESLNEIGIHNVIQLAQAEWEEIEKIDGISTSKAGKFRRIAKSILEKNKIDLD